MKAILEFDLPKDKYLYETYQNAINMQHALDQFAQYLRNEIKYGEYSDLETGILNKVRNKFFEILEENDA